MIHDPTEIFNFMEDREKLKSFQDEVIRNAYEQMPQMQELVFDNSFRIIIDWTLKELLDKYEKGDLK